ncbi:MAG TPA: ATP-binding protein [Polyangiaceae bacterium]
MTDAQNRGKDFRELADMLPMTVFEVDRQGRFTYVNRFGLEFSGYSQQEIEQGIIIEQIVLPTEGTTVAQIFQQKLEGAPDTSTVYRFITRDGRVIPVNVHSNAIFESGVAIGLRGVVVDLSEQKRVAEATARAERLEAAGRIAGQVAHDFNNLLAPILAYLQLAREKLGVSHPVVGYLGDIELATRQMAAINEQLLTLARRGHYELSPLDVNGVVRGALALLHDPPANLRIVVRLGDALGTVLGCEAQLSRVIHNLVNNARDAMHDAGELTIETSVVELRDQLGVLGRIPGGKYVALKVADTGPGIAPTVLRRIFEPFFTTKVADRHRGSGLGLSTVYAVLQDHSAYLDVATEIGRGTTFSVFLPQSDEPISCRSIESLTGGSERILVVDDEPMQRQLVRHLLERLGYHVELAHSGEHAISVVEAGFVPEIVVLDMLLGTGIDGAETYRQLLERHPRLRALLLSANLETAGAFRARALGVHQCLKKPLDIASLARAVRCELDA